METESRTIEQWMRGYIEAWSTDDEDDVAALFTEDAVYRTTPYAVPKTGRAAIVAWWVATADSQNAWDFSYDIIAADGDTAVVRAITNYDPEGEGETAGKTYSNIWVVKFGADGRAREFTEWWMRVPDEQ